jgi:hypothetical protein
MYTSKIDALIKEGNNVKASPSSHPKDLGFPMEDSGESWEVHLNDAFENILHVTITKPPSSCMYIKATKVDHL